MAEHAAHLTSATNIQRPSIFEVLAQDNLMLTLRPAGKHAVRVLAETRPEKFGWLLRWYDELYLFFDFVIQHHYLCQYGASFAENFYDLVRVPAGSASNPAEKLNKQLRWRSILFLVFIPYIKQKLDLVFEYIRYKNTVSTRPATSLQVKLSRAYIATYPYVHLMWDGASLVHMLAYTFQQSRWHSFLLRLSGTELCHNTQDDTYIDAETAWDSGKPEAWVGSVLSAMVKGIATALSSGLSVGVFFLQFLDWWYNSDARAPVLTALPIPDPPSRVLAATSPYTCPLCGRLRTNDTALSVSGCVFCFPCIHEYITKNNCCPVTSYPARTEHLIKIYQPDS